METELLIVVPPNKRKGAYDKLDVGVDTVTRISVPRAVFVVTLGVYVTVKLVTPRAAITSPARIVPKPSEPPGFVVARAAS